MWLHIERLNGIVATVVCVPQGSKFSSSVIIVKFSLWTRAMSQHSVGLAPLGEFFSAPAKCVTVACFLLPVLTFPNNFSMFSTSSILASYKGLGYQHEIWHSALRTWFVLLSSPLSCQPLGMDWNLGFVPELTQDIAVLDLVSQEGWWAALSLMWGQCSSGEASCC